MLLPRARQERTPDWALSFVVPVLRGPVSSAAGRRSWLRGSYPSAGRNSSSNLAQRLGLRTTLKLAVGRDPDSGPGEGQ